ncbi:response regulator transcription factor [Propionivibrio dicarboxylicus]|uniref:DNA-binding response regulator, NarL/FixJ family, contains REC and HTH domains n=1 Tax=Propionivibrio dicarboxylicus TaxID=83767 RepID=A0A1G8GXW0_9RHOO|nr:response regulator transcription factor [Propionivibrio dicarboxylicus]SDH99242.1 DNA-binding response regulator, NarL/FixJ family, contains REC and HTH domains [Propionivibrio dicarboxylicus]
MKSGLIIADDHPMMCHGLSEIIARTPDLEVVAIAHDGEQAETMAKQRPADLLILDVAMPIKSGLDVLESLRSAGIRLPVLFFSMYPPDQYVPYIRKAGAQGFIGKDAEEKTLLAAIRKILAGNVFFPSLTTPRHRSVNTPIRELPTLSSRENEVLNQLLRGTPLVDIAAELGISPQSVTTYRRRLLDKLGVKNNVDLIRLMGHPD